MQNIYPYIMSYQGQQRVLCWCDGGNAEDYFLRVDGEFLIFRSLHDMRISPALRGVHIHFDEVASINMGVFFRRMACLRSGRSSNTKACRLLLNGWSFLEDLVFSLERVSDLTDDPQLLDVVDKLFYGNNLLAITPAGRQYHPLWRRYEVKMIRQAAKSAWLRIMRQAPELA